MSSPANPRAVRARRASQQVTSVRPSTASASTEPRPNGKRKNSNSERNEAGERSAKRGSRSAIEKHGEEKTTPRAGSSPDTAGILYERFQGMIAEAAARIEANEAETAKTQRELMELEASMAERRKWLGKIGEEQVRLRAKVKSLREADEACARVLRKALEGSPGPVESGGIHLVMRVGGDS